MTPAPTPKSDLTVTSYGSQELTTGSEARGRSGPFAMPSHILRLPKTDLFANEIDYFCFEFYRLRTGPEFAGHFDSSFWQRAMVLASLTNPTVRAAAVALGAVHRRYELGITPLAFEYCQIAARSYDKAIRYLREDLKRGEPDIFEHAMITSMFLSAFEAFQNNYAGSLHHVTGGLTVMLSKRFRKVSSVTRRRKVSFSLEAFIGFLRTLEEIIRHLSGRGTCMEFERQRGPQDMPERSFESARDNLFNHMHEIMRTVEGSDDVASMLTEGKVNLQDHVARLVSWVRAYADCSRKVRDDCISRLEETPYRLFRVYIEAAYLLLWSLRDSTTAETSPAPDRDLSGERQNQLDIQFARLIFMSEGQYDGSTCDDASTECDDQGSHVPSQMHSWSVDTGMCRPRAPQHELQIESYFARSGKIRHQLFMDEGLRPSLYEPGSGLHSIAENLMAMEGCVRDCRRGTDDPASNIWPTQPTWLQVTCYLEEKKLLVMYSSRPSECDTETGQQAGEFLWTQDWYDW